MNYVDHKITLDIHSTAASEVVRLKKRDSARRILVYLTERGQPYHIDEDCYAVFTAQKPDGKIIYNECTIDGDTIIYEVTDQTTAAVGLFDADINLYSVDGDLLTSPSFTILVSGAVDDAWDENESTSEYKALSGRIDNLGQAMGQGFRQVNEAVNDLDVRVAELEKAPGGGGTGADGFSPAASVTQTDTGATITITDKNGTTTATIANGKDGADSLVCNRVLPYPVPVGETTTRLWSELSREPKVGEVFNALCGTYYTVFEVTEVKGSTYTAKALASTDLSGEPGAVQTVNGKTGVVNLNASDVGARPSTWMPTAQEVGALPSTYTPPDQTAEQVGADPKGTAAAAVSGHNTSEDSHCDLRLELKALSGRLSAFLDSDDTTLDQLSELIAGINSNKGLIESVTTGKVSVSDIINNLTTNVANKPLSAAQGVVLKGLIDTLNMNLSKYTLASAVPTKVSQLENDMGYLTEHQDISGKLDADKLPEAIDDALAQAKASGEFDGKHGVDGQPGKDGYTPVKGTDYFTEADKAEMVENVKASIDGIPSYWLTHLSSKIPSINTAMKSAGRNKSAFYFYTDAHRISSANMTPAILRYLYLHTSINKTNNGGDFFEPFATGADNLKTMRDYMADMRSISNHHSVLGNHDEDNESLVSDAQLYGFYLAWEESNDIVWGGYHYYYIDNKSENTRYLYLDIGKNLGKSVPMVSNKQMQFVIDSLGSLPEGWHVVPIAHIWYDYEISAIPDYVQNLLAVFDAYNGCTAGSVTHNGNAFAYDFAEALGNVEFCIGGHVHADMVLYSDGGIPVIITDTDSTARKGSAATLGTITEGCIDAVVADYNTRKIKLIRIGRGADRTINIPAYQPEGPEEIVNILNVYDIQYNKRYSPTSNGYKDANGIIAFSIPLADVWNKTVYFKGFSNITNNTSEQVSAWYYAEDESTTVRTFFGTTNSNVFTATALQENNGVYSIAVDKNTTGDPAFSSASDRLQIQMVMNSGTAVSAADLANCIMTIDQPIE